MQNEGCASCHQVSDPPGLALEHFDGLGQLRTLENGALIDVSADMEGKKINGAKDLGKFMHDDPRPAECLVRNVFYYGVGRAPDDADGDYLAAQAKAFAKDGYKLPALYQRLIASPEFFKVVRPEGLKPSQPARVAQNSQGEAR
jgi:hypothetical protein